MGKGSAGRAGAKAAEALRGAGARRVVVDEKMPRSRKTVERLATQRGDKTAELYRTVQPDVDTTASVDSFMRGDGTYVVEVIDSNGKKQVIKAQDANEADRIKRQYGWREGDSDTFHGPYQEIKPDSAAQRILDRLNNGRWSGVTKSGKHADTTPSKDMPTLEYVRAILADNNNPEAADVVRTWMSDPKNEWRKRLLDSNDKFISDKDLLPGETRESVVAEIDRGLRRPRFQDTELAVADAASRSEGLTESQRGEVGIKPLSDMPRSDRRATKQAPMSRRGKATAAEVAEIERRSGRPIPGPRSPRPVYLQQTHDATDPALKLSNYDPLPQSVMEQVLRGEPGSTIDSRIAALVESKALTKAQGKVAKKQAEEINRIYYADGDDMGGSDQAHFDRRASRAIGAAPHERAVNIHAGFDEYGNKLPDILSDRTVGHREFDGHGYKRGASTPNRMGALDALLGGGKGKPPVYLPASYTSPREAALDLLQTVNPEDWELDGLEKAIADRFRDAKWAEKGKAVRGKGAGPFEPPVRKSKEAAPEVDGEAPITNPLPEGGSPVGVADEALTEVEDMGKGAAGRAGAKGAEALKTAGAKGGKPPRGRKPATSVPDNPRNFSPDEDAPLPPSQRRKAGVDPNFESEAGMLDGDPVDVRAPMTNPLPEGGSPVGLADDAANGPTRGRGRKKPDADSPADIFPDEFEEPNPARDRFRQQVKAGLGGPSISPDMDSSAGIFPLPGNASQMDAALAHRQALEAAEARKAREAAAADDSFLDLERAAQQAAAENAARRAEDPNFYDSVDGADDFDPNAPAQAGTAVQPPVPMAQQRWDQMTGNSQNSRVGVTEQYGPMGDMYGPSPRPAGMTPPPPAAAAQPDSAQNIRILLERFKRGEPAPPPSAPAATVAQTPAPAPAPAAVVTPATPPAAAAAPDPTGGRSKWPSMGQSVDEAEGLRKASGEKATPNNGPAARDTTPPAARPQEPMPTDSPGMIRRLAGRAGKLGLGAAAVGAAMYAGSQLGQRAGQPPFVIDPQGGAGGPGGQRPGGPLALSPQDAMMLEAQMERAARTRNNGFQTSFHFGR